jgi:hypothetical protein
MGMAVTVFTPFIYAWLRMYRRFVVSSHSRLKSLTHRALDRHRHAGTNPDTCEAESIQEVNRRRSIGRSRD